VFLLDARTRARYQQGMRLDLACLPNDPALLQRVVRDLADVLQRQDAELAETKARLADRDSEIEKLRLFLSALKRQRFGRSSEKCHPDQMALSLEAIEEQIAALQAKPGPAPATAPTADAGKKNGRRPLPGHLPREERRHEPAGCGCPSCGGKLHVIGEDVSEVLDYQPARFKVIRHVRPRFACRTCESVHQTPMPSLPIERGRPGPGLLAHVLVAKYADHTPLYRQSAIYAREGVELDRSTLADWVGRATWLLQPLGERLAAHVFAGIKVHADDTPVPVLDPGRGRTKKGRLWVYVRDDRPCADVSRPAAVFFYTPDRKGERPAEHLARFTGFLQADAYAGFDKLYGERIVEVACWAHLRRKIFDVHESTKSQVAADALQKIGELYAIEKAIRGKPPDRRRDVRQEQAKPRLMALCTWFEAQLARLPPKGGLAQAIRYALGNWTALVRYADDGRLEIDNNRAENTLRGVALGRKNWLFAGSDTGGERAAVVYSLIETCKLNDIDPEAYLRDVLTRIAEHPINRLAELLPWHWIDHASQAKAA
jgi:transposase